MDKKKDRTRILTLALCVALLGLDLWQLRQLSDLRNQLGSVETNLQMESRRLDEQVQAVRRDMKSAEELVRSWEDTPFREYGKALPGRGGFRRAEGVAGGYRRRAGLGD